MNCKIASNITIFNSKSQFTIHNTHAHTINVHTAFILLTSNINLRRRILIYISTCFGQLLFCKIFIYLFKTQWAMIDEASPRFYVHRLLNVQRLIIYSNASIAFIITISLHALNIWCSVHGVVIGDSYIFNFIIILFFIIYFDFFLLFLSLFYFSVWVCMCECVCVFFVFIFIFIFCECVLQHHLSLMYDV